MLDFTIPQGADGASGVTSVTAGTPTQSDGYTVTPLTFNFEQGNSATVNVSAQNGAMSFEDYAPIAAQRQDWRDEINALEAEIAALEEQEETTHE